MKIYKYVLDFKLPVIRLPYGAKFLHAGYQNRDLCLWYLVDPEATEIKQKFKVIGTGHDVPDHLYHNHLFTVQDPPFVWHIFQENK